MHGHIYALISKAATFKSGMVVHGYRHLTPRSLDLKMTAAVGGQPLPAGRSSDRAAADIVATATSALLSSARRGRPPATAKKM